jgi:hypothetical protein
MKEGGIKDKFIRNNLRINAVYQMSTSLLSIKNLVVNNA